jgi:addiction module HigA family antidote
MEEQVMAAAINEYRPDYAVPPGSVLEERLEAQGISHAEFARRCGRSPKLISELIAGKAPLEPETALQFEKVLGVDASVWLGIEADYQLHRARAAEASEAAASAKWAKAFPVKEMVKRRCFPPPESGTDAVSKLLAFFGVASVEAWKRRYSRANVAYRHSRAFKSDEAALAIWLRLGEIEAERQDCAEYNEGRFKQAAREIRGLTRIDIEDAWPDARELCNRAGIVLALVKPLQKTALSGAAWWPSARKAVIQLSARHKTDDHLWFTFFHEAAHILLHSKKSVFVDGGDNDDTDFEAEANEWARNMLVSRRDWERFVRTAPRSKIVVKRFADEQGIAPGIVVGMLQHKEQIPWTHLNGLKIRLEWQETE